MKPLLLIALIVSLTACREDLRYEGAFDTPVAVAVLQPEDGSPWRDPVGFVASAQNGQIGAVDLKHGRFLVDDPLVSFLRGNFLPTGRDRLLTSLAVLPDGTGLVRLIAGDRRYGTLVEVPYVIGIDENDKPIEGGVSVGEPVFVDADNSGDAPSITDVEVKLGYTTTETWTVTFDGARWTVRGSRSGRMEAPLVVGEHWVGDRRSLAFTLRGEATAGDYFTIETDNGLVEHDVGGAPVALSRSPDGLRVAAIVHDLTLDRPVVRWLDAITLAVVAEVALPDDARPTRLAWTEGEPTLLVADAGRPAVWEIDTAADDAVTERLLPWPILDVTHLRGERDQLYVAPIDGSSVWVFDRQTMLPRDANPLMPGVQGMTFPRAVRGIEAMYLPFLYPERNEEGVRRFERAIAISTSEGRIAFMEEATGCLLQDEFGPRTSFDQNQRGQVDYSTNIPGDLQSRPRLQANSHNSRSVMVNQCAGVALAETWTVRYDETVQAWRVRGSRSGDQVALAYEDRRYLSDTGAISFVIRSGATATREGWQFRFTVIDGVNYAAGDNDGDGLNEVPLELPGDPVYFHYRVGPSEGGYRLIDERPFVLVPAEASDTVGRVMPQEGRYEVGWN